MFSDYYVVTEFNKTQKKSHYFYLWIHDISNMSLRTFKYLSPFLIYIGAFRSFMVTGWEVASMNSWRKKIFLTVFS